jgi:hypothetical protein
MITIQGLTKKQKLIADLIWNCDSEAAVLALIRALPVDEDRRTAKTLMLLMIWDSWEQDRGLDEFEEQALEAIDRTR